MPSRAAVPRELGLGAHFGALRETDRICNGEKVIQRNAAAAPHFLLVITPLEKISICNAHPIRLSSGAMGDRAHFSRPYMESGYDDEGGKRKKKMMMMSASRCKTQSVVHKCAVLFLAIRTVSYFHAVREPYSDRIKGEP